MYSFNHIMINAVIHNAKIKAIRYSKTVLIRYHIVFTDHIMICREFEWHIRAFNIYLFPRKICQKTKLSSLFSLMILHISRNKYYYVNLHYFQYVQYVMWHCQDVIFNKTLSIQNIRLYQFRLIAAMSITINVFNLSMPLMHLVFLYHNDQK